MRAQILLISPDLDTLSLTEIAAGEGLVSTGFVYMPFLCFQELSLDFIHGYRGFDTRNNLHYLPDGDLVYHAAGAGVVLSTSNGVQSFYLEHTDDIISLAVNQHPKFKVK